MTVTFERSEVDGRRTSQGQCLSERGEAGIITGFSSHQNFGTKCAVSLNCRYRRLWRYGGAPNRIGGASPRPTDNLQKTDQVPEKNTPAGDCCKSLGRQA